MRVLITRPAQDSARTAEILKARGCEAVLAPLFTVKPLPHSICLRFDAYLATSANAIRKLNFTGVDLSKPMFTVGNATAKVAILHGFVNVHSADGDSQALADLVRRKLKVSSRVAYLTGQPRNDAAVQALAEIFTIDTVETYETIIAKTLPEAASNGLLKGHLDAALHFSPRGAAVFTELVDKAGLFSEADRLLHVYISQAAQQHRFSRRAVANYPTLESMLEHLKRE